ncbi:hypothetical protein CFOL_v3_02079 [Cephalotus follicularis]|uniref:Uncharacterized protein n=1 Tax=Cephalotus follicularis TaxID=3775 RepID=A0A1Q3AS18_CEPFO|nr:hypothetical protein CFOL_v3_02079 [Cephalotus follicularis]
MFVTKSLNNTTQRKNSNHLVNVVLRKNESLRDYLTRFNKESLMVKDLVSSFALAALNNGVRLPHDDPVVVTLQVELSTMKRILLDSGSSVNILYKHAFDQLRILADQLRLVKTPLVGFAGEMAHPLGSIDLSVVAGIAPCQTQVQMTFLVVDTPSPYNAIIGHRGLNFMEAIVSKRHLLVKFPTRFSVGQVRGDQQVAKQCYQTAIKDKGKGKALPIANVELRGEVKHERPQPVEDSVHVPLEEGNTEKYFQIGSQLGEVEKED